MFEERKHKCGDCGKDFVDFLEMLFGTWFAENVISVSIQFKDIWDKNQ